LYKREKQSLKQTQHEKPNTDQSSIRMRLELRTGEDVSVEKGEGGGTALLAAAD